MNMRERIVRLERECEEYRMTIAHAAESLAQYESGEALARMREQRDLLWMFARHCSRWAHTCQCGHRANDTMEKAGLGGQDSEDLAARIDPKLALRLEVGP